MAYLGVAALVATSNEASVLRLGCARWCVPQTVAILLLAAVTRLARQLPARSA